MLLSLKCEFLKLKRKHTLFILLAGVFVQMIWCMGAMFSGSTDYTGSGYQICLYQFPILNALCFPVLIAVLVSNICDMEHKGNTHKQLFVMQEKGMFWNVKWIISLVYIFVMLLFQITSIYFIGKVLGFSDTFIIKEYALYFLSSIATSLFISTLILTFATLFKNQFIPFFMGITAGFLGFMSAFFPAWLMRIIPSSYYMLLSTSGMNWDSTTRISTYYYRGFPILDFGVLLAILVICFYLSKAMFMRKGV